MAEVAKISFVDLATALKVTPTQLRQAIQLTHGGGRPVHTFPAPGAAPGAPDDHVQESDVYRVLQGLNELRQQAWRDSRALFSRYAGPLRGESDAGSDWF